MKLKEKFKKLWDFLNGKKTIIGTGLHAAWLIANIVFPDMVNNNNELIGHGLIFQITGVGISHKAGKLLNSDSGKKVVTSLKKLIKK